MTEPTWLTENRAFWDDCAGLHERAGYGIAELAADPTRLSDTVAFDRDALGDLAGLDVVHLQCHLGTDTVSLARLGARMTGLDLSGESIRRARTVAERCGVDVTFVEADVYDAAAVLGRTFDLVYTGVGALCWLPDVAAWARVVADLLRPGGRLVLREDHPLTWALADARPDGLLVVERPYFEQVEAQVWDEDVSYVTTDERLTHTRSHEWNHGIGEVVTAVLHAGLVLDGLTEHRVMAWRRLPGQMVEVAGGQYALADRPDRLPLSYTLLAHRPE